MQNYVIFTDSGCDITPDRLAEWGVKGFCFAIGCNTTGEEYDNLTAPPVAELYGRMRAGESFRTSAANIGFLRETFEPVLAAGKDVLYLSFGSGLSSNYHTAALAAEELSADYPKRTVRVVDTLAASAGHGLLVYLAAKERDSGKTLTEVADTIEAKKLTVAHRYTVDDLQYLKRGGRVSAAAAVAGAMLGIKPLMRLDDAGKMVVTNKVRGRKTALQALADHLLAHALPDSPVFLSHADCADDAAAVVAMLQDGGREVTELCDISPVVGVHCGPGTIALFYLSDER